MLKRTSFAPSAAANEHANIALRAVLATLLLATLPMACKKTVRIEDTEAPASQQQPAPSWEYRTEGASSWACVQSVDEIAELCFRHMQGHLDSYLKLPEEGNPFICYAKHCQIKIQLDAGAVETVEGTDDENGGTRVLFLPGPAKLLNNLQHAKELTIGPPMFGTDRTFVFRVNGLNWHTNEQRPSG